MSKAWAGGSTRHWRRVRATCLALNQRPKRLGGNDGRCTLAIPGVCEGRATEVHHTLGRAATGDDPRYLAAVCKACNLHMGDPAKHEPQPKIRSRWTR